MKKLYQSELYTKHHWKIQRQYFSSTFCIFHTSGNFVSDTDCSDRNV